jgi:hypothetical protein
MSSHLTAREAEPGSGVTFDHPAEVGHQINIIDVKRGVVEATPKRDKVAIMGFATSSRSLAPFDDPSYEIWTLNQLYRHVPRCTRHFDIHRNWEEDNVEGTDHRGWIKEAGEAGIPTYMVEHHPDMPSTVQYPIDAVIEDVGCDYFTSTVAYEVALAVAEGFKEIALFGIDLIVGTEYDVQKANLEFHLGRAHGMGINVVIPPQSALLTQSHRYGYQKEPNFGPLRIAEIAARIDKLGEQKTNHMALLHALDGAISERERIANNVDEVSSTERVEQLQKQRGETMALLGTLDGASQEATYWRDLFTLRSRGASVNPMVE